MIKISIQFSVNEFSFEQSLINKNQLEIRGIEYYTWILISLKYLDEIHNAYCSLYYVMFNSVYITSIKSLRNRLHWINASVFGRSNIYATIKFNV